MDKPILYMQTNSKWKNLDYSALGEKTNIGESGCGPTCMAMIIATLKDTTVTPIDTCKWSKEHGYKAVNQGTYYSYFAPQGKAYGIDVKQLNGVNLYKKSNAVAKKYHDEALAEIKKGNLVIACMGKGRWTRSGHFILWYDVEGGNVLINDPYNTKADCLKAGLTVFQSEVKYYFVVDTKNITQKKHSQNYHAVQEKYEFNDSTMEYLGHYRWADSLFAIMLQDAAVQKYQLNTIDYILEYEYGKDIFERLTK